MFLHAQLLTVAWETQSLSASCSGCLHVCGCCCACQCQSHLVRSATSRWTEIERHLAGRFGFVELRTEELAQAAMQLDKVELCGRSINVGRPKGYVEPPPGARPIAVLGAAQA